VGTVGGGALSHTVVAMALSRDLTLNLGADADFLMRSLASFCTHYAVVEFMPKELWDGTWRVPPWYSLDWFRGHFLAHFDLMHEESIEENRILLIGRRRARALSLSSEGFHTAQFPTAQALNLSDRRAFKTSIEFEEGARAGSAHRWPPLPSR
jgi:hypothetical protein